MRGRGPEEATSVADQDAALLARLLNVRKYVRADRRAPHKPLVLLWELARVSRGATEPSRWLDACAPLSDLLLTFGGGWDVTPEFPFQNLSTDGIWEVAEADQMRKRVGKRDAPINELRRVNPRGGFTADVYARLHANPSLLVAAVEGLLEGEFSPPLHPLILNAIGWVEPSLEGAVLVRPRITRVPRDPAFRRNVLEAYGYRCAMCGLEVGANGPTGLLEAAHLKWFAFGRDNSPSNGLCLCPLHHTALDLGLLGITDAHRVRASPVVVHGTPVVVALADLHDRVLVGPVGDRERLARKNIEWHHENVFRKAVPKAG